MANTFTTNLNLAIPDPGDLNWENEYSDFTNAVDDMGNLLCFTVTVHDAAIDGTVFFDGFIPQENISVRAIGIFALIPPTGQDLMVDIIKNSVAQNSEGILTDASQFEKTSLGVVVAFSNSDRLGLKFTQVGSVNAGDRLVVTVYFQKEAIATV
jgi:co-chaperonin GroES (HSP10)